MADVTISQLTTVNALTANNFIPISDGAKTTKLGTESLFGFRNRIINGNMRIDQRNNGAIYVNNNTNYLFNIDRFRMGTIISGTTWGSGVITGQQVNDAPPEFNKSLKLTVTTADPSPSFTTSYALIQPIEANNVLDFSYGTNSAKPVTISFWVKSSITGSFSLGYRANTETGPSAGYHYVTQYTIFTANSWEYKKITIPGLTLGSKFRQSLVDSNSEGVAVYFDLGSGSTSTNLLNTWLDGQFIKVTGSTSLIANLNATFYLTGLQLEVGNTATPFESRPIGLELSLCQRYYYKLRNDSANQLSIAFLNSYASTRCFGGFTIPVQMRSSYPTTTFNKVTLRSAGFANDYTVSNMFLYDASIGTNISLEVNTSSSVLGTGNFFHLNLLNGNTAGGSSFIAFDAEL